MNNWKPTIGKWYDEGYDIKDPIWKSALQFAERYHIQSNHQIFVSDQANLRNKVPIPYVHFLKSMMKAIIEEAYRYGDIVLTVAAFYGLLDNTECTYDIIATKFGIYLADAVTALVKRTDEDFDMYVNRIFSYESRFDLPIVLVAVKLLEFRLIQCPFEDWEEDTQYYTNIENVLSLHINENAKTFPGLEALYLKLKDQLEYNCTISLNCNKTAEELFLGLDD